MGISKNHVNVDEGALSFRTQNIGRRGCYEKKLICGNESLVTAVQMIVMRSKMMAVDDNEGKVGEGETKDNGKIMMQKSIDDAC